MAKESTERESAYATGREPAEKREDKTVTEPATLERCAEDYKGGTRKPA
ncbi:hypothetical protein [Streptomyces nanshensis]|nr:hypothetical protein [Streptomyces nanshensis]